MSSFPTQQQGSLYIALFSLQVKASMFFNQTRKAWCDRLGKKCDPPNPLMKKHGIQLRYSRANVPTEKHKTSGKRKRAPPVKAPPVPRWKKKRLPEIRDSFGENVELLNFKIVVGAPDFDDTSLRTTDIALNDDSRFGYTSRPVVRHTPAKSMSKCLLDRVFNNHESRCVGASVQGDVKLCLERMLHDYGISFHNQREKTGVIVLQAINAAMVCSDPVARIALFLMLIPGVKRVYELVKQETNDVDKFDRFVHRLIEWKETFLNRLGEGDKLVDEFDQVKFKSLHHFVYHCRLNWISGGF